jgi:hypothetical protein
MSAGQTTDRFYINENWHAWIQSQRFWVCDSERSGLDLVVDMYRYRSGAERAASLLNRGAARVDSHAIVGCKVVAS